jgi:hypothetical protein
MRALARAMQETGERPHSSGVTTSTLELLACISSRSTVRRSGSQRMLERKRSWHPPASISSAHMKLRSRVRTTALLAAAARITVTAVRQHMGRVKVSASNRQLRRSKKHAKSKVAFCRNLGAHVHTAARVRAGATGLAARRERLSRPIQERAALDGLFRGPCS